MRALDYVWPAPQKISAPGKKLCRINRVISASGKVPLNFAEGLAELGIKSSRKGLQVKFKNSRSVRSPEGYNLSISETCITVKASGEKGFFYAAETLLQIFGYSLPGGKLPCIKIEDAPVHKVRAFMVDLGRSSFSLKYLKRIIRIMASLKMNALHLHLYDDQLFGIRLKGLPLGRENPSALTLADLKDLIKYAGKFYVEIIPEIEAWGHVGSIVYHYPELKGGPGMYGSTSFLICGKTLALIEEIASQIISVMPDSGALHFGLDEANWYLSKETAMEGMEPAGLVGAYYEILKKLNKKYRKKIKMWAWADHGGRPLPDELKEKIVIEPWNYWIRNREKILKELKSYGGKDKPEFMMAGGISGEQFRGAYQATRLWSLQGMRYPNVMGIDIAFWGTNDISSSMLSLFASFGFCWNPQPEDLPESADYETLDQLMGRKMMVWQLTFKAGRQDLLFKDMGPVVYNGFFLTGKKHGKPVAKTADLNRLGYYIEE